MARRLTTFVKGGYYHIYNRGANRDQIFREEENFRFMLQRLKEHTVACQVTVVAYCLMPNHYHLLLRQDGNASAGAAVQAVFNSYSKAFNARYERSGTLFQGPFRSISVHADDYLIHLCRYIHRNPLDAGLVTNIEDWSYSNYPEWIGVRRGSLVDMAFIKSFFAAPGDYRRFVLEYVPPKRLIASLKKITFD